MLLEEFDPERRAVINPDQVIKPVENMPEVAVTCFSRRTFERMLEDLDTEIITWNGTANGEEPVYRAVYKGMPIALFILDVGAPVSVGMLEEVFQMGVQKVVVFGNCGVLDSRIEDCSIIIPDRALRDEGTSYHYAPSSDEIEVNQKSMKMFTELLDELHVKYTVGKTWTTDSFYRETPEKVKRRKAAGCICVEMECSANAAVCDFRGKKLLQFFYAADNLDAEEWDSRSLANHSRMEDKNRIAAIALEAAVRM